MKQPNIEILTNIPIIELDNIILRAVKREDYLDMYDYGKDDEVTKTLLWDRYENIDEAKSSCERVFLSRPSRGLPSAYAIVDKVSKKMIGTCDFCKVVWAEDYGEIGYVLNRDFWGKGYMTKACNAVMKFGFEYLGLDKIEIGHFESNIGSKRVIEKCGFKYTHTKTHERTSEPIPMYELYRKDFKG